VPVRSRKQLVLDMSRADVRDYLFDAMAKILHSADISYVKWDMNRHLSDVWSAMLPSDRQGEVYHRYVLGVYDLLERVLTEFPDLLLEGCSGGGGRFDAGMLYYSPQIWCSDNTDAVSRLSIQLGTSFGYPIKSMGSHVSVCPNHGTGRTTPLKTRGDVAMMGTFGYELDLCKLSEDEKTEMRRQIEQYKQFSDLICTGDFHRLALPFGDGRCAAWMFVSPDKREALLTCVWLHVECDLHQLVLKLRGLDPDKQYYIDLKKYSLSGRTLMTAGLPIRSFKAEYPSLVYHLKAADTI
jgi:alpha-galactosidase